MRYTLDLPIELFLEADDLSPRARNGCRCFSVGGRERLADLLPEDLIHARKDHVFVGKIEWHCFQSLSYNKAVSIESENEL